MATQELRARFVAEDEMSDKLEAIADSVEEVSNKFEELASSGSDMFDNFDSISEASSSLDEISSACDEASNSMADAGSAFADAGDGASEMADSISEAESSMDTVADSAEDMSSAMDEAGSAAEEMADAAGEAGEAMSDFAESGEEVADAASSISDASSTAGEAMSEIGSSAQEAGSSLASAGEQGSSAISALAAAISGAGIVAGLKEIASSAKEMADAFSDAQKTIVNATGATDGSLDSLSNSMLDSWGRSHASIQDTAGAIGEINTRMGLTGDSLSTMTNKFLDFSDITGTNVVSSVRSASQILNQWGMDTGEATVLMDKLAYTGQKTGISVDTLSSTLVRGAGSFKAAGLSLDNTISLLGDFETIGIDSTQGVMAMRNAVTKLAKSGGDVKTGLTDAIDEIAHMSSESEAAAKATELFGSRAGQAIALGIRSGALSTDSFNASLDDARGTLELTAEAGETMSEKWTKAFNKIQSGFDKSLAPGIESLSDTFSGLADGFGDFLNSNTEAASVIAGVTTGVLGAAAAFTTLSAAMAAVNSIQAGTGILGALFGGFGALGGLPAFAALAAGIGLVTTAFMDYSRNYKAAYDDYASETSWTRSTREELEGLQAQYDQLSATHQEGSAKAQDLKLRIDELSRSLDENGQSVEQLFAQTDSYLESHDNLMERVKQSNADYNSQTRSHEALLNKIKEGVTGNEAYAGSAADLSNSFALLDKDMGITSTTVDEFGQNAQEAFKKLSTEVFAKDAADAVKQSYQDQLDLKQDQADLENQAEVLSENRKSAEAELNDLLEERANLTKNSMNSNSRSMSDLGENTEHVKDLNAKIAELQDELEGTKEREEEVADALDEVNSQIESGSDPMQILIDRMKELTGASGDVAQGYAAAGMAIESHQDQLSALADSYQQTYQTAKQSFDGQFGLFDEANMASGYTMQKLNTSLDSQIQYWDNYATNVGQVTDWLSTQSQETQDNFQSMMDFISTGTPEAANLAYDLVRNLDEGNEQYVQETGKKFEELEQKKETAAKDIADYENDITEALDNLNKSMQESLEDNEDLSEKAKESGKKVLDSYMEGLQESLDGGDIDGFIDKMRNGLQQAFEKAFSDSEEGGGQNSEVKTDLTADPSQFNQAADEAAQNWESKNPKTDLGANTEPAESAEDQAAQNWESKNPETNLEANGAPAESAEEQAASNWEGQNPTTNLQADTGEAEAQMEEAASDKEATVTVTTDTTEVDAAKNMEDGEAKITVTADTSQLESAVSSALSSITGQDARITVEADTAQAQAQLEALKSLAESIQAKVNVTADTSQAQSAMGELSGLAAGLNVNIPVTSTGADQVISQLNQIQSLGNSTAPVIHISETGADQVISQINAIAAAAASVSPVVITVTDNGTAAAVAAEIAAIPTSKTVTVTVNEVGGSKVGHWQGTTSSESSFYAGELGPELIVQPIAKYADGTTFSDGMYIAGENGPELITGAPGSTVFPASETNRIIESLSERQQQPLQVIPNADGGVAPSASESKESGSEKHIVIDINGGGSVSVSGNSQMDKEQVLSLLQENMKPVLMQIIQSEIYEEGDLSYDY